MNLFNIERSFKTAKERGWDRLYWFIDYHDTIGPADYGDETKQRKFYPYAKKVLQFLSKQPEICLILFTCSHRDDIDTMLTFLKENEIYFNYVNENPECHSSTMSNFSQKPYINVLLDDKAGFEGEHDWRQIGLVLERHYNVFLFPLEDMHDNDE